MTQSGTFYVQGCVYYRSHLVKYVITNNTLRQGVGAGAPSATHQWGGGEVEWVCNTACSAATKVCLRVHDDAQHRLSDHQRDPRTEHFALAEWQLDAKCWGAPAHSTRKIHASLLDRVVSAWQVTVSSGLWYDPIQRPVNKRVAQWGSMLNAGRSVN